MAAPEPYLTAPKTFISYSWDDDEHKEWVKQLATRLRADGVDVTLDRWHAAPGDHIPAFIKRTVRENDFVIAVCTPRFKERSDGRGGGVGYEGDIMTAYAFTGGDKRKFIPVLRCGSWSEAAPTWLLGRAKIDLSRAPYSESEYEELLRTLHGAREEAPPIGQRPKFGDRQGPLAFPTPVPLTPLAGSSTPQHQSSVTPGGPCEPPRVTGAAEATSGAVADSADQQAAGTSWAATLGLRFRLIPPGRFLLGAADNDPSARADERPRSPVEIHNPLWVAAFPLTNGATRQLLEAPEAAIDPDLGPLVSDKGFAPSARNWSAGEEAPVTGVSCDDAERVARFLARKDGLAYRLPTEAEWEYMARAGATGGVWWPGDRPVAHLAVAGRGPQPAGDGRSNAWGLTDVLGNVEEWTSSAYGVPLDPRAATRPAGPLDSDARAARGGSWRNPPESLRLYRRSSWHRAKRCDIIGIRLVCEVS